ncbi:MAG TPA: ABC transporter permease [Candidatus Sulfotelmatobacter sp.]|nr:ABC transporter permease [Candidatus Sulfotelmatobacter sp.]
MNLALRDIRRHMMRFVLTCFGLGLLLTVVMAMSGIYRGLIGDATKVVEVTPAQVWVVQKDTRGPFAESSRLPEDLEYSIAAVPGVRRASAMSFQYVQIPRGGKPVRLFLIGYKLGGIGGPSAVTVGRAITKKHYEIVVDTKSGYSIGDKIHLGLEDYTVVGLTRGMTSPSGDPAAFISLADAQIIQFQLDNDAIRNNRERVVATYAQLSSMSPLMREKATQRALAAAENPHFANAIVAELGNPSMIPEVSTSIRRWNHYQVFSSEQERELLLKGFIEKSQKQLWLFRTILVIVSGVIIALIIYTLTMDKLREIATLKIIGAADRTIVNMILQQSLLLGLIGFAVGYAVISRTYTFYPRTVVLQPLDMAVLFFIVVVICVLASILGIGRALKVDPGTALSGG